MLQILQIFDPEALLGFISEVAENVSSDLYGVIETLSWDVWNAVSYVWNVLMWLWGILQRILSALWAFIQQAVAWLLQTALPAIEQFIQKILSKIKAFLTPIINYIKAQIQFIQQIYNTVIKPLMNFLQRIRAILTIFRLLHIKWATVLDQYIQDLENRINQAFLNVEGDLGRIEQWLQFFADPAGMFNPFPFLSAAILSVTQLYAVLASLPSIALGAIQQQQQAAAAASGQLGSVQSSMTARSSGPTSDDLAAYQNAAAAFQGDGYTWVR